MKAVLAATAGKKKLYYVLDAESADADGVVVNEENRAISVNFFSFAMKSKNLNRMKNTPFHRFLWSAPNGEMKQIWIQTFVLKERPIGKKFTEKLVIQTQLGESAKKQKKTDIKVKSFLSEAVSRTKKIIS
jgi:hypothetical protein